MRIFLYEYASAQPPAFGLPASVRVEGRAMLSALVEDFARVPGIELLTIACQSSDDERGALRELAGVADWSLIIAPEFDGLLLERCRWVLEADGRLLGPSPDVVALTGDKWATFEFLTRHRIRTPRTELGARSASKGGHQPLLARRAQRGVCKPRYGAGSLDIEVIEPDAEVPPGFLAQELVPGRAASVAFLAGPEQVMPLLPAEQLLSADGRFRYLGGRLPLAAPLAERAVRLASAAIRELPQPLGYLGVDLVLGEADDGSADHVIEINPRLTTSYVGLRRMTCDNLAERMLRIAAGGQAATPQWFTDQITFSANGMVGGTP